MPERFSAEGHSFALFRKGEGPGVILLHELPGLTKETLDLAQWLVDRGFHIVMPLLFGAPLQNTSLGFAQAPLLCLRKEFNCLAAGKASPVTVWLRALCRKVHGERGGPGVGAIGMCFTGGFVFSLLLEPSMLAPVTAQPSLPLFQPDALDVEAETLAAASRRHDSMSLLGLRFEDDWRCPAARFQRLGLALQGTSSDGAPRFLAEVVPGRGHATLTYDHPLALARGIDTRRRVFDHLSRMLTPHRPGAGPGS